MVNVRDHEATRLDVGGLVTFSGSLFLLVFALLRGNDLGWSSTTIVAMLAGAAVLMAAFVVVELRQPRPMLDLSLFRRRAFTGVSIATLAIGGGMFAVFPYLTLYLQNVLGLSPFQGGLRLLAATLPVFLVPLLTRGIAAHAGRLLLGLGLAITAAGLVVMSRIHTDSDWTAPPPGLLLTGTGIDLANPAIAKIALGVVPPTAAAWPSDQQHLPHRRARLRRRPRSAPCSSTRCRRSSRSTTPTRATRSSTPSSPAAGRAAARFRPGPGTRSRSWRGRRSSRA